MEPQTNELGLKARKPRKDKGISRGPRKPRLEMVSTSEPEPPVFVSVRLKGMEPFTFGCSQHFVENGFHVFVYPSRRDRYRETRREIAISEVIDIEITGAFNFATRQPVLPAQPPRLLPAEVAEIQRGDGRPVIHSAKDSIMKMLREQHEAMEQSGPVRIDSIPEINRVKVGLSGSD